MRLTPENKETIDKKSYKDLLSAIRFSPSGDPWFEGETGTYWLERARVLKDNDPSAAVAASKEIGW